MGRKGLMMSSWLITTDFALKNWLLLPARSEAKSLYISRAKQNPARPNMLEGVAASSSDKRKSNKARILGCALNRYGASLFKNTKPLDRSCVWQFQVAVVVNPKLKGNMCHFLIQRVSLAAGYLNIINILVPIALSSIN